MALASKEGSLDAIEMLSVPALRPGHGGRHVLGVRVASGKIAHVGHGSVRSAALAALAALAIAGCGASARNAALSQSQLQADYRGAPAPLARLFARQNKLLGGGSAAFERELRSLRGYPVIVNAWASWCDDCQAEFSIFQRVAPRYGRKVAFIGDDVADGGGSGWLAKHPLSFPSYRDHSWAIARAISAAASGYAPITYFLNRRGQLVYPHFGPYLSAASLEHDIRLYLGA
jgi:cytochrome c biogenesis protein CcmG/thiol:disulfide interchange protein DsbE